MSIKNVNAIYKCLSCGKSVDSINSKNLCKKCRGKEVVEEKVEQPSDLSEKVWVEKCGTRSWSAPNLNLFWVKESDKHLVLRRNLRDYDIKSGIKRKQIRIVEEEPIEPVVSNETIEKVKEQDSEW